MNRVSLKPADSMGQQFIPKEYLSKDQDQYTLRNIQSPQPLPKWRHLRANELENLVKNNNNADSWDNFLVTDDFNPDFIKNCSFFGLVRIGRLQNSVLEHHDLQLPTGIYNSLIVSCDIGNDVAIHNVSYLAHYIIGNQCILANIDEMHTTNHAKFGNGIVKTGEPEEVRVWMDLMNENGGRQVMPFDGMVSADAYLWAKYRDNDKLLNRFNQITQNNFDSRRGYYGTVGNHCVIKNSRILKDVKVGSNAYIKGANKLKNLTINSDEAESTQIGEGVELVNGIVGYGCNIFYGCKAVRFVLGNSSNLKYGARLINSYLGDNSTISCCEVLNNLIFPFHEQHHNNSFLIASIVMGQSNMAAGATIGSNHNSRSNDHELKAGRGFWPGLCTSIKHPSCFASFVLMSKGDYPSELNVPVPFSLLNNNVHKNQLEVIPAFWWLYNMYALSRNSWKFQNRDKRKHKIQNIESDPLAPDTAEEIIHAMGLLEKWTAKAYLKRENSSEPVDSKELACLGKKLLMGPADQLEGLEICGDDMERSKRKCVIAKAHQGYHAYREMLLFYAVKNILAFSEHKKDTGFSEMQQILEGKRVTDWTNLGGQLLPAKEVANLCELIISEKLNSWDEIHNQYDKLWEEYPLEKQKHAWAVLCFLFETETLSASQYLEALNRSSIIQDSICKRVYESRKKDFESLFQMAVYRNREEMEATIGNIEDNSFVQQIRDETKLYKTKISKFIQMDSKAERPL
ncbi:hypothetical protein CHISP_1968 [Chitinispirillum alkaliphilum]|nr:hypothetical protein CHISP_1968 [Chitinispirillum alkaliphilum]